MKVGDIVQVFCKPLTDEQPEGIAVLVQHFADEDDSDIGERWTVRFVGRRGALEVQTVDRWVNERNLLRETPDALIVAFVQGAQWWEYHESGATMWASDRDQAEGEAETRLSNGTLGKSPNARTERPGP